MMQFKKARFMNTEVRLDFISYDECVFDNCVMAFSGYGNVQLTNCEFRNVRWIFTDAANNTIRFLGALYRNDAIGQEIVTSLLKQITGNGSVAIAPMVSQSNANILLTS